MIRAFWSEWLKLRRPAMLFGGVGSIVGFAVLAIVLTLRRLGSVGGPGGSALTALQVNASDGFAQLMANSATFIGVVALALFAIAVGTEYGNGTLRNLLVRQPSRPRLLAGKMLALASFVAIAAILAFAAALVTALLLAPGHGISTSAWFTHDGVRSLQATIGNLLISTVAWGAIGAVLALMLRSTATAIAVGLAYALVVENLLSLTVSGSKQWLPGQLIDAIARGGSSSVSYVSALLLVGLYLIGAAGIAGAVFRYRDVAS
jgi:ABC-2 type transport system permease protein